MIQSDVSQMFHRDQIRQDHYYCQRMRLYGHGLGMMF